MGDAPVSGRTRDADRSREAILDAAEALFAERGYEGASLQEIGRAAGVSRGTPGYFFGSKERLYQAVLERAFAAELEFVGQAQARAAAAGGGP
ncbi:MAG: TetR/AcrR family transcriptional regulator, partial [Chloroflexota bacterium]|nr:TetR/AcrR family transcriptional regulator [Chloroflexota bacterium]